MSRRPDIQTAWQEVSDRLRAFVAKRVADQAEVDDILQEVFLRTHQKVESLRDPRRLVPWLFQITRHAVADHYRAPARGREVPGGLAADLEAAHHLGVGPSAGDGPDSGRLREELAGCLRPLIARLSDEYREAITLVELEGLAQNAAARRLGLSASGMKSRVQRGRRQLKRLLDECCLIQLDRRRAVTAYAPRRSACDPCAPSRPQPLLNPLPPLGERGR